MSHRFELSHLVTPAQPHSTTQQAFVAANAIYYTNGDWALDIRERHLPQRSTNFFPGSIARKPHMYRQPNQIFG